MKTDSPRTIEELVLYMFPDASREQRDEAAHDIREFIDLCWDIFNRRHDRDNADGTAIVKDIPHV